MDQELRCNSTTCLWYIYCHGYYINLIMLILYFYYKPSNHMLIIQLINIFIIYIIVYNNIILNIVMIGNVADSFKAILINK